MCLPGETEAVTPGASRPRWSALYGATVLPLLGLAAVEVTAPSPPARVLLRWAVALGTFLGIGLWVRANRAAFDLQNWCACAGSRMRVRVVESGRPVAAPVIEPLAPAPQDAERELVAH